MQTFKITTGSKFTWATYFVTAQDETEARASIEPELAVCTRADMENMTTDGVEAADFAYRICDVELTQDDTAQPEGVTFINGGLNG